LVPVRPTSSSRLATSPRLVASLLDEVGLTGTNGLTLQVNVDTLLLGLALLDNKPETVVPIAYDTHI
jgi:hypothetical protein